MSDFTYNDCYNNSAYQFMRPAYYSDRKYVEYDPDNTQIIDIAGKKAENTNNKSAITIALEDFTDATNGFNGYNSSNIDSDDTKKGLFRSIGEFFGIKDDNIFRNKEGAEYVKEVENVFQSDIYNQEIAKNGGIMYCKEGDDTSLSALNFAKAEIGAIEKANNMANPETGNTNGKLEMGEIGSYIDFDGNLKDALKELDLDGKEKYISAQEYASYMMAIDGMVTLKNGVSDYSKNSVDGIITPEQASAVKDMKNSELQAIAQKIYDENYKK